MIPTWRSKLFRDQNQWWRIVLSFNNWLVLCKLIIYIIQLQTIYTIYNTQNVGIFINLHLDRYTTQLSN